jgi:hypothetical protein
MVRIWGFAVITAVVLISSFGCGQQGAGNAPSGSAEQTTSPRESSRSPTTTTTEETTTPSGLVCPSGNMDARVLDYARGAKGEKGNPVEIARREFSKKIREGDAVEKADRTTGHQGPLAAVHVIREGRVVAYIEYRRAGGGWLQEYYEACGNF